MDKENKNLEEHKNSNDFIANVNISLRYKLIANAINGIMANPHTAPTQQAHFDNIAEDAIRIADTVLSKLSNEKRKGYYEILDNDN